MEATILNKDFVAVGIIDIYKSFIWTDRYDEYGDFEIYIPISDGLPENIQRGYYLWTAGSEHIMIIESIVIETDEDAIPCYAISGRSLESILTRRIIWGKKIFKMDEVTKIEPNLQESIKTIFEENIINPVASRQIPNFIFEESTDEKITSLTLEAEYMGDEIYNVVKKLCQENEIGFKVTLNNNNQFVFKLYAGVDRSYGDPDSDEQQITNSYVIFSPKYDNLFNSKYLESDEKWKNVAIVFGETKYNEDGEIESTITHEVGTAAGLERREAYTDATSLSWEDELGGIMKSERYEAILRQKGIDTLIENTQNIAFTGEVDPYSMFIYGRDYFIGDIVQICNEYGNEGRAYISEYVLSCDANGKSAYPTFKIIQKGVYET